MHIRILTLFLALTVASQSAFAAVPKRAVQKATVYVRSVFQKPKPIPVMPPVARPKSPERIKAPVSKPTTVPAVKRKEKDKALESIFQAVDRTSKTVWNNKGAVALVTLLSTFWSNPEPFLDAAVALTGSVGEFATKRIVEPVQGAVLGAAGGPVVIWAVIGIACFLAFRGIRYARRR